MSIVVYVFRSQLGRTVLNKTERSGKYDFKLEWTPDPGQVAGPLGDPVLGPDVAPPPDPNGPSIFSAIQEQLGLRLDSQRGPVELIVIDR